MQLHLFLSNIGFIQFFSHPHEEDIRGEWGISPLIFVLGIRLGSYLLNWRLGLFQNRSGRSGEEICCPSAVSNPESSRL